jgi:hypothetical protein
LDGHEEFHDPTGSAVTTRTTGSAVTTRVTRATRSTCAGRLVAASTARKRYQRERAKPMQNQSSHGHLQGWWSRYYLVTVSDTPSIGGAFDFIIDCK